MSRQQKHIITAVVKDKKGRVLATAQNSYIKTHPLMAREAKAVGEPYKIYLHAEVAALLKSDWANAHSIFVSRYNNSGEPLPSRPCEICQRVIKLAGIKEVRYT